MSSMIPCQIRYRIRKSVEELAEALSVATRKLSTRMPIKLTAAEGHPAWMVESPGLAGMLMIMHSDLRGPSAEAQRAIDIKYRDADRDAVEDLAALLGCVQADILIDVDAADMSTPEPHSATEHLLMASGRELAKGFHILDMAFASGQDLVQDYNRSLVRDIRELDEIRKAIEAGEAEARFGRERLAQYLREEDNPVVVGENTVDHALPHTLHIPSDGGRVLRVHYAWDAGRRLHVIGYLDDYAMN